MLVNIAMFDDEDKVIEWLIDKGLLKRYNRCICSDNRIYRVRGKKYKCYNCKYE